MNTKIEKIDVNNIDKEKIEDAAQVIRDGGLVAFPTETVYGLGADAMNPVASREIYAAKGRPSDNPLIIHIAKLDDLKNVTDRVSPQMKKLAEAFWPGPLTMVVPKKATVPYETTGGLDTVAIRMPSHPVALAFIEASGTCIAAPSANTSGRPSPTAAEHVLADMGGRIPVILDGGEVDIGIESTIIDLTEEIPMILRPGYITRDMLESVIGEVSVDPGIISADSLQKPKAPGMKYRHYAPKADLKIIEGADKDVVETINTLVANDIEAGFRVGIIATDETQSLYPQGQVYSIGTREDEDSIAKHLYGILRKFDEIEAEKIYSESFRSQGLGQAIMNRLLKASGYQVLQVSGSKKKHNYKRIIFVGDAGICRAPMAAEMLKRQALSQPVEILSRGLVVLFPEPMNQKAEAVMISNGYNMEGFMSCQLEEADITEDTLVLTMTQSSRQKICETFSKATEENVAVLTELVGDELEILDPYGGNLQAYGICYETLHNSVNKLVRMLNEGEI